MKILTLFLIPISASNTFGFLRLILIELGVANEVSNSWRIIPLVLGILISIFLAKSKMLPVYYLALITLGLGLISSFAGIVLGVRVGSDAAVLLALLWLSAFSLSMYKLPINYGRQSHA